MSDLTPKVYVQIFGSDLALRRALLASESICIEITLGV